MKDRVQGAGLVGGHWVGARVVGKAGNPGGPTWNRGSKSGLGVLPSFGPTTIELALLLGLLLGLLTSREL